MSIAKQMIAQLSDTDLTKLSLDELNAKMVALIEKEKKDGLERLKNQERKVDYFVRARREVEQTSLQLAYQHEMDVERAEWGQRHKERVATSRQDYEKALCLKRKLSLLVEEKALFVAKVRESHAPEFEESVRRWQVEVDTARARRLEERKQQRREQRKRDREEQMLAISRMKSIAFLPSFHHFHTVFSRVPL